MTNTNQQKPFRRIRLIFFWTVFFSTLGYQLYMMGYIPHFDAALPAGNEGNEPAAPPLMTTPSALNVRNAPPSPTLMMVPLDIAGVQKDSAPTVAGKVTVISIDQKDGSQNEVLLLGPRVIYDQRSERMSIDKAFSHAGKTILLVSISDGGNSFSNFYAFVTISPDGSVAFTEIFGNRRSDPVVTVGVGTVSVTLPNTIGGLSDERWSFAEGKVRQGIDPDVQLVKNAPQIQISDGEISQIRGRLTPTYPGKTWSLNLPTKSKITGDDCLQYMVRIPVDASLGLEAIQGLHDFNARFQCSRFGITISDLYIRE